MDRNGSVIFDCMQSSENSVVVDTAYFVDLDNVEADVAAAPSVKRDLAIGLEDLILQIDVEQPRYDSLQCRFAIVLPADFKVCGLVDQAEVVSVNRLECVDN